MSLTRAFTTRRAKQSLPSLEAEIVLKRSNTTKGNSSIRNKISGPVQLIHTTNVLSYNAPDLYPKSATSIASSSRSDNDVSDSVHTNASSPPTSPDVSLLSKGVSEPNHLSSYFTAPAQQGSLPITPGTRAFPRSKNESSTTQPSMSRLSEQWHRTMSTKASFTFSRTSSNTTGTAATSISSSSQPRHMPKVASVSSASPPLPPSKTRATAKAKPQLMEPASRQLRVSRAQTCQLTTRDLSPAQISLGPELARVTELAEEYGSQEKLTLLDIEEHELVSRGFFKFRAEDYLGEIESLFVNFFGDARPSAPLWI